MLLFFFGEDAKYRIQERPSSLLSLETESLLERRNSKFICFVIEWSSTQCRKPNPKPIAYQLDYSAYLILY